MKNSAMANAGHERSGSPDALFERALTFQRADDGQKALELYAQVLKIVPDHADTLNNIGALLSDADENQAAVSACRRAIAARPSFMAAHNNLGLALRKSGDMSGALDAFSKALAIDADVPEVLNNTGEVLKSLGRFMEAETLLSRALILRPDYVDCARHLADLVDGDAATALSDRLTRIFEASEGEPRMLAAYGLATLRRKAGQIEATVALLDEAGAIGKTLAGYRPEEDAWFFDDLKSIFETPPPIHDGTPCAVTPVFVLGMPRSGTTLVERMLARHPDVTAAGERTLLTRMIAGEGGPRAAASPEALARIRRGYLAATTPLAQQGVRFVTDKMPLNFRWIGHIRAALPEARILHIARKPEAVCWSILHHHFPAPGMGFAFTQHDIAHYHGLYTDLMGFWQDRHSKDITDVSYEALCKDPAVGTQGLADAVGLHWDPAMTTPEAAQTPIATASSLQARRPVYAGSSEVWKTYAPALAPMLEALRSPVP